MAASTNNDDADVVADLYDLVVKDLIAASAICPSMESSEYFDPLVNRELSDGLNDQGISNLLADCWHVYYFRCLFYL
jgi:hypothetical protein